MGSIRYASTAPYIMGIKMDAILPRAPDTSSNLERKNPNATLRAITARAVVPQYI